MMRDAIATAKMHFKDPRSKVMPDGRQILKGVDWKRRVAEIKARANGQCECIETHPPLRHWKRCYNRPTDPHHVIERSKERDDREQNLLYICRNCHIALDRRKVGGSPKERTP